jgi:tetrapyrrole methylase family protein/MazG family protein
MKNLEDAFAELAAVMHRLRAPGGCPWDAEQTHQTLKRYLIEETHEVLDAIDDADDPELCEELGDVLLQVFFHAELASEREAFDVTDVARVITEKLIRRHPHVFADTDAADAKEVARNWDKIKQEEKRSKAQARGEAPARPSAIDGIPRSLPALEKADIIGVKARKVGFDWQSAEDVPAKILEELQEVADAKTHEEKGRELGDLLLAVASYARLAGHHPEEVLSEAVDRFGRRFRSLETETRDKHLQLSTMPDSEKEAAWQRAKRATDS